MSEPGLVASLAVAGVLYLAGARRAPSWPARRSASFLAGLGVTAIALGPGLEAGAEETLAAHMVQHLLLAGIAAPLLVLGTPLGLALRALPTAAARRLAAAMRSRPLRSLVRPAVATLVFTTVLAGIHVPAFYDAALASAWLHAAEHGLIVGASLAFWTAVTAAEPIPRPASPVARLLALLASMPPMALLGALLVNLSAPLYASYEAAAGAAAALADQQDAGMVMWGGGGLLFGAATLVLAWTAMRADEERERERERLEARRAALAAGAPRAGAGGGG